MLFDILNITYKTSASVEICYSFFNKKSHTILIKWSNSKSPFESLFGALHVYDIILAPHECNTYLCVCKSFFHFLSDSFPDDNLGP